MKKLPNIPAAFLMATLSGLLLAAAWPDKGFPGLMFIALVPMFFAEKFVRTAPRAFPGMFFMAAWWGFFVFNFLTTYWVYNASGAGAIVAWVCNSMFMALVWQSFSWLMRKRNARTAYWGLILLWIGFEFGHMRWDLSWPWLSLGNAFANFPEWIQWYEITGAPGGSLWVLLSNLLFFFALQQYGNKPVFRRKMIMATLLVLVPMGLSYIRYATYQESEIKADVVVVQPNIDPWNEKFSSSQVGQLYRLVNLGLAEADPNTDYIICPETALPSGIWAHEQDTCSEIRIIRETLMALPKTRFITGLTYLEKFKKGDPNIPREATPARNGLSYTLDYNSAMQIDHSNRIQIYHKSKLVPGPEMMPFAEVLEPFQQQLFGSLGGYIGNMGRQKERSVFTTDNPDLVVAPVICYESVYGDYVTDYIKKGATFIAIVTNDGWWGDTPGYRQHFAYARLRAIENRRSIARSANTGYSGFINERGDVVAKSAWWEETALRGQISINKSMTFYSRNGDLIGRVAFFGGLLLLFFSWMKVFLAKRRM
ncbi:MAG: apolipoprotein N-acyltransferase [Flavobacteriales bacterium]